MTLPADLPSTTSQATAGMVRIEGGGFRMGSDHHYPEEAPARTAQVASFWIDPTPVTNAQFARFVQATGYVTFAERPPNPADYPGILPHMVRAGSLVFRQPDRPVALDGFPSWWEFCFGADWRHPEGPGSDIAGRPDHPVTHVAYEDAAAYATWAGKVLPSEAEWEYAARGGLDGAAYAWGDELAPDGRMLANYWQGDFPAQNLVQDGYERTSPVGAFPPNGYGLSDMIGNVWEWTQDWFVTETRSGQAQPGQPCCGGRSREEQSYDPCQPEVRIGRRVLKGGSHLCAPNYCQRYRPAARYPQPVDTSTSHVGFRCIVRD